MLDLNNDDNLNYANLYSIYFVKKEPKHYIESLSELKTITKLVLLYHADKIDETSRKYDVGKRFASGWKSLYIKILQSKNLAEFNFLFEEDCKYFKKSCKKEALQEFTNIFIESKENLGSHERLKKFLEHDLLVNNYYIFWPQILSKLSEKSLFEVTAKKFLRHPHNNDTILVDKLQALLENKSHRNEIPNIFLEYVVESNKINEGLELLFDKFGFDKIRELLEKSTLKNFDYQSHLINFDYGKIRFVKDVAKYLLQKNILHKLSLDSLVKILKNDIDKEVAQSILEILNKNFTMELSKHTDEFKKIVAANHPVVEISQVLLEDKIIPNLINSEYLYKVALESEPRAQSIIGHSIIKTDEKVREIAKKHTGVRGKILELNLKGEIKLSPETIKQFFKFSDNTPEVQKLLLEKYFLQVDVGIWL